ncbi:DUF4097 family beta strand repeat-containing protein [Thermomonospora catenispora]|uniref:DUF4097 family beta strand repeat-containing protein n=1 Tax=Thermomonospora catenispora TaxID=2493090 RepID=UPI001121ACB4|nr:DUF4097 family beta strand repeat-containing protein [Thermomonospora catenispora]TNY37007.1 hypothetical protein EIO00_10645 [Thermomonospora catenispora]
MTNRRTGIVAALAATGMAVALGGCALLDATTYHEDRRYRLPATVSELSLRVGTADVEIVGSDTTTINVHERLSWSKERKPTTTHRHEGRTLVLSYACPDGIAIGVNICSVDYRIEMPRALAARIQADTGDIRLRALAGPLRITTDSGNVTATDLRGGNVDVTTDTGNIRLTGAGSVRARTDVGNVILARIQGRSVTAATDAGNIQIGYRADRVPDSVTATTDDGNVQITVPATVGYALDTRTRDDHNRPEVTGLRIDSGSPHRITVTTGYGNISVTAA